MQFESITKELPPIPVSNGVLFLSGYGLSLNVDKNFLIVKDGFGRQRRESKFSKATSKIKSVVIHGHNGIISLAAIKWLNEIGAGIVQIDWDGEVLLASAPHRDVITLKRAQYEAQKGERGVHLARFLTREKLEGQLQVLFTFTPDAIYTYLGQTQRSTQLLASLCAKLASARSISQIRDFEALSANVYWQALYRFPLVYSKGDLQKIPKHWLTLGARHSLIIPNANRNATNPGNAILNYLYALLYSQTRIAIRGAGLDLDAPIIHADDTHNIRESFVYDVMEAIRPAVDAWFLEYVKKTKLKKRYFYETERGTVRITLQLTPILAETISLWKKEIAPVVAEVCKILSA